MCVNKETIEIALVDVKSMDDTYNIFHIGVHFNLNILRKNK